MFGSFLNMPLRSRQFLKSKQQVSLKINKRLLQPFLKDFFMISLWEYSFHHFSWIRIPDFFLILAFFMRYLTLSTITSFCLFYPLHRNQSYENPINLLSAIKNCASHWKTILKCMRHQSNTRCWKIFQKQPFRCVLGKRCSENRQQIYRRTPMPKCDFNKVASAWVFSCKFAAYF